MQRYPAADRMTQNTQGVMENMYQGNISSVTHNYSQCLFTNFELLINKKKQFVFVNFMSMSYY